MHLDEVTIEMLEKMTFKAIRTIKGITSITKFLNFTIVKDKEDLQE